MRISTAQKHLVAQVQPLPWDDSLPATVRVLYFHRENISALSSLVDTRRIALQRDGTYSNQYFVHSKFYNISGASGKIRHIDFYIAQSVNTKIAILI